MELLIQPGSGISSLLDGIARAKKSIEIVIFRLDQKEIENALKAAVSRGVKVSALVAYTNREGERSLRKLEMRLLEAGVTVMRTADDLLRYHDKFLIVDRRVLYLLAFNFTTLDIEYSRSFGLIIKDRKYVQEACKLFEADSTRQSYQPALNDFLVSPLNARKQLSEFIKGARKQLLIYDNQIGDREMVSLLKSRAKAGVEIRIIGTVSKAGTTLKAQKLAGMRLHTRTIIRDGKFVFIGSQSLRKAELDARREVGLITRDARIIKGVIETFEADWAKNESDESTLDLKTASIQTAAKAAKKAVKALANDLPALAPVVRDAVVGAVSTKIEEIPENDEVKDLVKGAVIEAVREAVQEVIQETVKEAVSEIET